ncbi:MAG: SIS domain-containing protein [Bryobacterales bacterium]
MSQMLKEIQEQPAAIERTLLEGLADAEQLRKKFAEQPPRAVVLIARGTSDNAATFGRYLIEITTGLPVSLAAPSVTTLYGSKLKLEGALVVGVSQSGESTDVNACMEAARQAGAFTLGVTNEAASALAQISEATLLVRAGREKSVAATKTYTGQLVAFYLLAYALGGGVQIDRLKELPETVESCLALAPGVRELANRYRFMERVVVIGRGLNYANAFEFALKLMETCYVTAERFFGRGLRPRPDCPTRARLSGVPVRAPGADSSGLARDAAKTDQTGSGDAGARPAVGDRNAGARSPRYPHSYRAGPGIGYAAGSLYASAVHRASADVRCVPSGREGIESGSAENVVEGDENAVEDGCGIAALSTAKAAPCGRGIGPVEREL